MAKLSLSERGAGDAPFVNAVRFTELDLVVDWCRRLVDDGNGRQQLEKDALMAADKLRFTLPLPLLKEDDMHDSVMAWADRTTTALSLRNASPVLEVGSYNVNGSVRSFFDQKNYVGTDVEAGPGVDQVISPSALPFDADKFAVVISTEMLEHAAFPALMLIEMRRVLRPGGLAAHDAL